MNSDFWQRVPPLLSVRCQRRLSRVPPPPVRLLAYLLLTVECGVPELRRRIYRRFAISVSIFPFRAFEIFI